MKNRLITLCLTTLLSLTFAHTPSYSSDMVWAELMKAGQNSLNQEDFSKAEKLFLSAKREAEEDKDEAHAAEALFSLAQVSEARLDWTSAEQLLRQSASKAQSAKAESTLADRIRNELRNVFLKQGIEDSLAFVLAEQPFKSKLKDINASEHPYSTALKAFRRGDNKKAEAILLNLLQRSRDGNDSECMSDVYCVDVLYQIYVRTNQLEKCEKLVKSLLEDIKTRRDRAIEVSFFAAHYFLYLGALCEIQNEHDEADVMFMKGLRIFASVSGIGSVDNLLTIWIKTGRKTEAQKLLSCIEQIKGSSRKKGDEIEPKYASVNTLRIVRHFSWWKTKRDGAHPSLAIVVENIGPNDLSNVKIALQAIFRERSGSTSYTAREEVVPLDFHVNQQLIVKFCCPMQYSLPMDSSMWPRVATQVIATIQDSLEAENLLRDYISKNCISDDEAMVRLRSSPQ